MILSFAAAMVTRDIVLPAIAELEQAELSGAPLEETQLMWDWVGRALDDCWDVQNESLGPSQCVDEQMLAFEC